MRWMLLVLWTISGMWGVWGWGCSGPSATSNTNANLPNRPTPQPNLPALPTVLQQPSSAEDLAAKIKTLCEQETQNVHNVIRCQGKYTSLYCEHQGGVWATMDNGCVDRCDVLRNPASAGACRDESPFGCDCGKDYCWTGLTCERNP